MNETVTKTVLLSGGNGAMGKIVHNYINTRNDFLIEAIYDPSYKGSELKSYQNLQNIHEDVVIDFSPASAINKNIIKLITCDKHLIIGSSGLSKTSLNKLKNAVNNRKIIVIPNFSIGAAYQKLFSLKLSTLFENIYIVEKHHSKKQDAPSGTAIDLAESLPTEKSSKEIKGNFYKNSKFNNKNIYSLRGDEYLAEQIVNFSNEYEELNLEHIVTSREAYVFGLKLVLDQFDSLNGFNIGLENILADKINI